MNLASIPILDCNASAITAHKKVRFGNDLSDSLASRFVVLDFIKHFVHHYDRNLGSRKEIFVDLPSAGAFNP